MGWIYLFGIALLAIGAIMIYLIFIRKKFTRERFAFFAVGSLMAFSSVTIIPLFSGNSLFVLISQIVNEISGWSLSIESNFYDKTLSIFVFFGIIWLIQKIHSNWDGKISERHFNLKKNAIESGLIQDAVAELKRDNTYIHDKKTEETHEPIHGDFIVERKERLATLLSAYSSQYTIDKNIDWYEDFSCFLSTYGKDKVPVLIHCPTGKLFSDDILKLKDIKPGLNLGGHNYVLITPSENSTEIDFDILGFNKVDIFSETEILDRLSDVSDYKEHLRKKIEEDKLPGGCDLTLSDTYVHSSGVINGDKLVSDVSEYIREWCKKKESGHIAILGEYGQGKSTLSYKLAYDILKSDSVERIPVVLELRGKSPRNMSLDEMVLSWCKKFGVDTDALMSLNSAGRLVLILEGFDEMDFVGDSEIRMSHFKKLWSFASSRDSKIIFTGRPNFFSSTDDELPRALLTNKSETSLSYCVPIRLLPFDNDQVEQAIRSFSDPIRKSLKGVINSENTSQQVSELLRRPSTLIWAAAAWDKLKSSFEKGTMVPANVLAAILTQSYDRQLNKKLNTTILAVERQFFTIAVALRMHHLSPGVNQISSEELRSLIEELVDRTPESLMIYSEVNEEVSTTLKDRFSSHSRLVETVVTDVRTCGVLVDDVSRAGYFKFAHKSFYEYMVGLAMAYRHLSLSKNRKIKNAISRRSEMVIVNALSQEINIVRTSTKGCIEIMQFAGQIFAQVVHENTFQDSDKPADIRVIRELVNLPMWMSIKGIKRFSKPGFSNRIMFIYHSTLLRTQAWKIAMLFHGCISLGVEKDALNSLLGETTVNVLSGDIEKDDITQKQLAFIFGFNRDDVT